MTLAKYKSKRDFRATPEPAGRDAAAAVPRGRDALSRDATMGGEWRRLGPRVAHPLLGRTIARP